MQRRNFIKAVSTSSLFVLAGASGSAYGSSGFPSKPIRLIVPFAPGGTTDTFARLFSKHFGNALGVNVIVENKAGASGLIGLTDLLNSPADGYTLSFQSPTSGVTGLLTRSPMPFDPVKSFSHVAILGTTPVVLAASIQSGIKSLKDLIEKASQTKGGLSYGSGGIGGAPHLSVELLRQKAGNFNATHVAYKGAGPALQDLMGDQIQFMPDTFTALMPMHKEGKIRIISILDEQRSVIAPEIPTAKEEGFDVVSNIYNYVSAPAGTPKEIINILNIAAQQAMKNTEIVERLNSLSYSPLAESTPEHASNYIKESVNQLNPLIKSLTLANSN